MSEALPVVGYVLKSGHGTHFKEALSEEHLALEWAGKPMWTPLTSHPEATARIAALEERVREMEEENERWAREANRCDDYISGYVAACSYIDGLTGTDLRAVVRAETEFRKWRDHLKKLAAIDSASRGVGEKG